MYDLEASINGKDWRWARFFSITPYRGQPYAIIIQNIVISWARDAKRAERFRRKFEYQLGKLAIVLTLAGASPRVVMVRTPIHEIEVVDSPS